MAGSGGSSSGMCFVVWLHEAWPNNMPQPSTQPVRPTNLLCPPGPAQKPSLGPSPSLPKPIPNTQSCRSMASVPTTPYPVLPCYKGWWMSPLSIVVSHSSGCFMANPPATSGTTTQGTRTCSHKPREGNKVTLWCRPCFPWAKGRLSKPSKTNSAQTSFCSLTWMIYMPLSHQPGCGKSTTSWPTSCYGTRVSSSTAAKPGCGTRRAHCHPA